MNADTVWLVVLGIAAIFGIHDSWWVTARYRAIHHDLDWRGRLLLLLLVVICWAITGVALWFGGLTARRAMGLPPVPEVVPLSLIIITAVLFLPRLILWVLRRIQRDPPDADFRADKEDS